MSFDSDESYYFRQGYDRALERGFDNGWNAALTEVLSQIHVFGGVPQNVVDEIRKMRKDKG